MQGIKGLLRGEEKLWKVFWLYGFLSATFVFTLCFGLNLIVNRSSSIQNGVINSELGWIAILAAIVAATIEAIIIVWSILVWKCARNTGLRIYEYMARVFTICVLLFMLFVFVYGPSIVICFATIGTDIINHPNEFIDCRKQVAKTSVMQSPNKAAFIQIEYREIHGCIVRALTP